MLVVDIWGFFNKNIYLLKKLFISPLSTYDVAGNEIVSVKNNFTGSQGEKKCKFA